MKTALLLLAIALPSFGAACTSFAAGDMLTAGNWASCGGGVPGNGDTVTITHAMTLAGSQTIGASLSGWAVTVSSGTPGTITCVSASCPFVNGMIVLYVRSATFIATSSYPTGFGQGARYCVANASGSPVSFNVRSETCGGALANISGSYSGTWYMREFTPAIQINSPGSVTINSGGDLIVRGDVRYNSPNVSRDIFTINAGGRAEWDSSQATNPNMTSYYLPAASAILSQGARVRLAGSSGNPAILTSSTANGALPAARHMAGAYDQTYAGELYADYADMSCIGFSSGTGTLQSWAWIFTATAVVSITNSELHTCSGGSTVGPIGWASGANGAATNIYRFDDSKWLDGADGCTGFTFSTSNAPTGAGVRSVKRSVHTCRLGDSNLPSMMGLEMEYNIFINVAPGLSCNGNWTYGRYNILINSDVDTVRGLPLCSGTGGTATNHHFIHYARICGNVRGMAPGSGSTDNQISEYLYGVCAQGTGVSDGDIFQSSVAPAGQTSATFRYSILAPVLNAPAVGWSASGGLGTGGIITPSPIRPWTLQNMTWSGCEGRVTQSNYTICTVTVSESQVGFTGIVANYKGNLFYSEQNFSPKNMMHMTGGNTSIPTNTLSAANADYNACFVKGGTCGTSSVYFATNTAAVPPWTGAAGVAVNNFGTHYDVPMTGGGTVPGTNDVDDIEPYFAGPHRTMEEWAEMHGETADVTGVTDLWQDMAVADLPTEIPRVMNWLFAGWTPFNVNYANSSAPSGFIGAVKPTLFFGTF
jgi:hypothetical protein